MNHQLEKAALEHTYQNQLLQSRLELQEQSFRYFSEEIHDNVGQVLSVVGMHLYQLAPSCAEGNAQQLLSQSTDLLNKAINDLRSISHTLNSRFISRAGFALALEKEIEHLNSPKPGYCHLTVTGTAQDIGEDRELLLFRIIQEALSNANKHAHANRIDILLDYQPTVLAVRITDDGDGFDKATEERKRDGGLGLGNMQLRAGLLGGGLDIQSTPGEGTSLSLAIGIS